MTDGRATRNLRDETNAENAAPAPVNGGAVKPPRFVLDATASPKPRWPRHAHVRLDILRSAKPDVVGTDTALPFRQGTFTDVYCDPPHMVKFPGDRRWVRDWNQYTKPNFRRFKYWSNRREWQRFLDLALPEFCRVLCPGGRLHFKVPDGSRSHKRAIDQHEVRSAAKGFRLIRNRSVESRSHLSRANVRRGRSATIVHYLTFVKVPDPEESLPRPISGPHSLAERTEAATCSEGQADTPRSTLFVVEPQRTEPPLVREWFSDAPGSGE